MKQLIAGILLLFTAAFSYGQGDPKAQQLLREGIALHDQGEYKQAIDKYDQALKIDPKYFDAHYEKLYSLYAAGDMKKSVSLAKDIIKDFKEHPGLGAVYVQYGSSLDDMGKSKDAIKIYDEGIDKFPAEYLLHFNKALTLQKLERFDEALVSYQHALRLKPYHSSSNYYTGLLLQGSNKVPALLALATFLAIEPKTERAADAITRVERIIGGNIKKEGNNINITLDPSMLDNDKKKNKENNFSTAELLMMLTVANDKGLDSLANTPAEKLSFRLQMLINTLIENKEDRKGFYWEHYVPFFEAMKEDDQVGTLAHLMYMRTGNETDKKWIDDNEEKIEAFYDWLKNYKWNK